MESGGRGEAEAKERILRSNRLSTGVHVGKLNACQGLHPPSSSSADLVTARLSLSIPLLRLALGRGAAEGRGLIPGSSVEREIPPTFVGDVVESRHWNWMADKWLIFLLFPPPRTSISSLPFMGWAPFDGAALGNDVRGGKPRFCSNKSSTLLDLFMQPYEPRYGLCGAAISNCSFLLPSFLSFFLRISEDREGELDTELTRDSIGLDPFQFKLCEEM